MKLPMRHTLWHRDITFKLVVREEKCDNDGKVLFFLMRDFLFLFPLYKS